MKLEAARGFNGKCRDGVNVLSSSSNGAGEENLLLVHPLGGSVCVRNLSLSPRRGKNTSKEEDVTFLCDESDVINQTQITCAATSPCGKFIAAGSRVNVSTNMASVRVWSVADESQRSKNKSLMLHKGEVKCLAFSPCSKYLASLGGASDNYQLVLWRLKDAKAMCGRNTFGATTLAFLNRESSNPSLVTAGAYESGAVVWTFEEEKRSISSEKCRLGQIRRDVVKVVVNENDEFA